MEFRVLGPFELIDEGRPIPLGPHKQRALLAALALHANEVLGAEWLVDALWGQRPPATAAKTIQVYVSQLRKTIGDSAGEVIATRPRGYVLQVEPDEVDANVYERLVASARDAGDARRSRDLYREAEALVRGPVLADVDLEADARVDVARLEELLLTALAERVDSELEVGRHSEVVGELEQLVSRHPLHERFCGQLMLALYRSGRQAEALRRYQETRRLLADELGLEPGEALRELERAILQQHPALAAQEPPDRKPPDPLERLPRRRRTRLLVTLAVTAVIAAVIAAIIASGGDDSPAKLPPHSLGRIDVAAKRLTGSVSVGRGPVAIAIGHGAIWVANRDDRTVTRVDAKSLHVVRTIAVDGHPTSLAVAPRGIWVRYGPEFQVARIDPSVNTLSGPITIGVADPAYEWLEVGAHGVAFGFGAVWTTVAPTAVVRVDPETSRVTRRIEFTNGALPALAVGAHAVWVAAASAVTELRPRQEAIVDPIRLPQDPAIVVASARQVWAAYGQNVVAIDARTHSVLGTIELGDAVSALCVGTGAIWAAHGPAGTVVRIDPATRRVTDTIDVGRPVTALAAAGDSIWAAGD